MASLRGVYNILSTPFLPTDRLDGTSLRRLIEVNIAAGIDGITVLGVAGEAQKLTDDERRAVLKMTIETVAGRVPVIVGISRDGTLPTTEAARTAEEAGASGVMVAPPTFLQAGKVLTEHFRRVGEAVDVPIVLQDYPPSNGVVLTPRDLADLVRAVPSILTIKLEGVPTPLRIAQTLDLVGDRITIVGGLGGMYMVDELRRGSSGVMTGFAYPEVLVAAWKAWSTGDKDLATALLYRFLPLLAFEAQQGISVAIRKVALRLRGHIDHDFVRPPAAALDPRLIDDLVETISRIAINDALRTGTLRAEP
jgi:4-hydroxy-tetrahydrodipicolinate synthase